MPESITTGVLGTLSPCVNVRLPDEPPITGVWSVSATVTVEVAAVLVLVPSLIAKLTVRASAPGVMAVES